MAVTGTLQFIDGAETGGLDLANSTAGSPSVVGSIASPAGRSGAFHYRCAGASTLARFDLGVGWGSGGTQQNAITDDFYLIGFAFRTSDKTPGATRVIAELEDAGLSTSATVRLESDSDLIFVDATGTTVLTITDPLTENTWHYIEFAVQMTDTGSWEFWLDGTSKGSGTSDFLNTVSTSGEVKFYGPSTGEGNYDFDDIYMVSHTSSLAGNALGPSEVFAYQGQAADSTNDDSHLTWNDNLDNSDDANDYWADNAQTPFVSGTWSGYAATGTGGATLFDTDAVSSAGHGKGPSSGAYTVTGTIQGASFVGIYQRGTGGGSDHGQRHGKEGTIANITHYIMDAIASSSDTLRGVTTTSTSYVPTSSEQFRMGAGTTGAQDIEIREQWAFLLHTPSSGTAHEGAAAITGVGTMTPNPKLEAVGAAVIAGTGTVTPAGRRGAFGAAVIAGVGTVAPAGAVIKPGAAVIAGTGTMTPDPKLLAKPTAAITGTGTVAAAGKVNAKAKSAITGTGTVTADPKLLAVGAAVIAGTGTVTPAGFAFKQGQVAITGTGTVTADPKLAAIGQAAITGTGTVTPNPKLLAVGAAAITGAGTVTTLGKVSVNAAAIMAGVGTVAAAGISAKLGAAVIAGTGTVTAAGKATIRAASAIAGTGTVTPNPKLLAVGAVVVTGAGVVTAAGKRGVEGAAIIAGTGTVTANGLLNPAEVTGSLWIPSEPHISDVGHNQNI